MIHHVLSFEGKPKKVKSKIVEYNLYLIAQNGSGVDSYVLLNNLSQWRSVVKLIKNGVGIISPKLFNGYVNQNKKNTSKRTFQMWGVHINKTLKKNRRKV